METTLFFFALTMTGAQEFPGMEGMGFGSGRRMRDKEPLAVKSDMAAIKCDVCEIVAGEIYDFVEKKRKEAPMEIVRARPGAPKKERSSFSEADVNTIVTDACNRRKDVGEWLWYLDLVGSNSEKLVSNPWRSLTKKERATGKNYLLIDQHDRDRVRKWDEESATIKRSCDFLMDEDIEDLEDFIVPLWRGLPDKKAVTNLLCKELSNRCTGKNKQRTPVADDRQDFDYIEESHTLVETERMMQNMEEQGMPMVMQSRDDMMQELIESLEQEGMSAEEARAFIDATTEAQKNGGDLSPDEVPDYAEDDEDFIDDEEEVPDL